MCTSVIRPVCMSTIPVCTFMELSRHCYLQTEFFSFKWVQWNFQGHFILNFIPENSKFGIWILHFKLDLELYQSQHFHESTEWKECMKMELELHAVPVISMVRYINFILSRFSQKISSHLLPHVVSSGSLSD